ncbi:Protein ZDS1 [Cyberlindnera fabianii]|uniref:Protein ZDS1 n=1 Tax=Cyberlindnera fabianii TaxID=36022 RepID=A0A1V2L6A3_CYBFA|nr:Protein ZDS1 [Cyberlindnera fabianii]
MSASYTTISRRTFSSHRPDTSDDTTRQRNSSSPTSSASSQWKVSGEELDLKAKRKSNAYLAAEAVQQERDAIKTLKRLSMGGSLSIDPDLPYGVDNEFEDFQKKRQHRRRSSSGSSRSSTGSFDDKDEYEDDFGDKTLIDDQTTDSHDTDDNDNDDEDFKIDSEKLMWVPAKSHPSIAPDQFRRHVQSTLDDITKKNGKIKSSDSIPSLKELTDELDKLSEMAGLAATDAVTLARSLSSASSSSSLLYGSDASDSLSLTSSGAGPSVESQRASEEDIDQDAPLLAVENSLKRNKWTTYTRRSRSEKDRVRRRHSPLSDENYKASQSSNNTTTEKQLPPEPQQQQPQQLQKALPPQPSQRSVSHDSLPRSLHQDGTNQLARSQSDISNVSKRTNHSRNRHAGSLINLNSTPDSNKSSVPSSNTQQGTTRANTRTSSLSNEYPQSKPSEVQEDDQIPPRAPRTPPLQQRQYNRPETQIAQEVPEPPTPIQVSALKEKEKEKEKENKSKSKEFLNMFKMKRSTSPKSKDKKRITPTRSTFPQNENSSVSGSEMQQFAQQHDYQQQQSDPHQQQQYSQYPQQSTTQQAPQKSPQRPSLRPTTFKLINKKDDKSRQQRGLQESVNVMPKSTSSSSISTTTSTTTSQTQRSPEASQPSTSTRSQQPMGQPPSTNEQHRAQRELLVRKLSRENIQKSTKPNAPVQFTDSAFGFPLPPLSHSTIIMLDYRFPIHVERALYRLSHLKLANPRRQLRQQVLLSNFMYAYLNLVNHTLYLQQLDEENGEKGDDGVTGDNATALDNVGGQNV